MMQAAGNTPLNIWRINLTQAMILIVIFFLTLVK